MMSLTSNMHRQLGIKERGLGFQIRGEDDRA